MKAQPKYSRILGLLLALFGLQLTQAFQQPSKIETVTVYLDGAEINRTATLKLNSGKSELTFNGLSPFIDESSIQVSGLKDVSILSINFGINYLSQKKQSDSISVLQNELKLLKKKIKKTKIIFSIWLRLLFM